MSAAIVVIEICLCLLPYSLSKCLSAAIVVVEMYLCVLLFSLSKCYCLLPFFVVVEMSAALSVFKVYWRNHKISSHISTSSPYKWDFANVECLFIKLIISLAKNQNAGCQSRCTELASIHE